MAAARAQRTAFVCQSCGASFARWAGRCSACDAWNSLVEEVAATALPGSGSGRAVALESLASTGAPGPARSPSGNGEFDRVTGGGIVPGSVLLVGGEPGIGKSTLLLELAARVAAAGRRALYISGEEAAAQVRLRAERLGVSAAPVALLCDSNLGNILATLQQGKPPDLVIVDSIQTLWSGELEAAPGSVARVRAGAHALGRCPQAGG